MDISVSESFFFKFFSEASCFESLIVLLNIHCFWILNRISFSLGSVVVNLLEDGQHVDDIANLFSKLLPCCSLLRNELDDLSFSESLEDASNKLILYMMLSKLNQLILFFLL